MNSNRHIDRMRRVATIAAIILLLGQTIAVAHYHPASAQPEMTSSGVGIADSSCAICAAHLHSPASSAIILALNATTVRETLVARAVLRGPLSRYVGNCFGRAPPASV